MTIASIRIKRGQVDVTNLDDGRMKFTATLGGVKRTFVAKECNKELYRKGILRCKKWIETGK